MNKVNLVGGLNNVFKKEMNMLKIFVCEGEEVLVLTNVEEMGQDEFVEMMFDNLTKLECEMISDLAYEGVIVDDERMLNFKGLVRECSFEDYIKDLKDFCLNVEEDI
jgi:hypothetical protein